MLTSFLTLSLWASVLIFCATIVLLTAPVIRSELTLWRVLGMGSLRRWISKRRGVEEPLHPELTLRIARRNIHWHLFFTGLFSGQLAAAVFSIQAWWRALAVLLVIPIVAYLAGSMVQRHKIAILRLRSHRATSEKEDVSSDS